MRSGFSCQTELIFKSEVVVGWDRRHSLNRSLLLDIHGLLGSGGHLDNLWSRLLLYDDLRLCLGQRNLAQRGHKLLTHGMQVLLPDHLILLEFKFSLRYEKLVVLIFQLLVQIADLGWLLLQGSKYVLRLDDRLPGSGSRVIHMLVWVSIEPLWRLRYLVDLA